MYCLINAEKWFKVYSQFTQVEVKEIESQCKSKITSEPQAFIVNVNSLNDSLRVKLCEALGGVW